MTSEAIAPTHPLHTDPRPLFGKAVSIAGGVVTGVRANQLEDPTTCPDYTVGGLMAHLLEVLHRAGAMTRQDSPVDVAPCKPPTVDDLPGWSARWWDGARDTLQAWADDSVSSRTITLPWATAPGAAQLFTFVSEVSVHTWDLATSTGQQPVWDDDVLAAAFEAIRQALPGGDRPAWLPFGNPVTVAPDAVLIDRLVAWNGRQP